MSYEGYSTYLCEDGHRTKEDASVRYNFSHKPSCPHCGKRLAFRRETDCTNGYYEEALYTHDAKVLEVGFTDVWHVDHHGNRFSTKLMQYKPDPADPEWKPY